MTRVTISPVTASMKAAGFGGASRQWVVVVAGKEALWFHDRADADEAIEAIKMNTDDVVVHEKGA